MNTLFAELYVQTRPSAESMSSFIATAVERSNVLVVEALEVLAGESARSTAGVAIAESLGVMANLDRDEIERLSDEVSASLCRAFHALPIVERQLLISRFMDEKDEASIAEELELPLLQVNERCEEALARFMRERDRLLVSEEETSTQARPGDTGAGVPRAVVADLVYELAKAELVRDSKGSVVARAQPRTLMAVREHVYQSLSSDGALDPDLLSVSRDLLVMLAKHESKSSLFAELVPCLRRIEGRSPRCELLESHRLITGGELEQARRLLIALLADSTIGRADQLMNAINLARVCLMLDRHDDIDDLLELAKIRGFAGPILHLSWVASAVERGVLALAEERMDFFSAETWEWPQADRVHAIRITGIVAGRLDIDPETLRDRLNIPRPDAV